MKRRSTIFRVLGLTVVLIAASAGLARAQTQVYVLESSAPSVKVGKAYALTDKITIPAETSIRVVMPSGKTQTIRGPYSGLVADLAKGERPNAGVIAWLKNLLQTGGSTEKTPGATRGARPQMAESFSWTVVPVTVDSTFCVEKGAKLQLDRGAWTNAGRMAIVDAAGSQQGEATWTGGSRTATWPANVALRPDTTYALLVPERPQRRVTLRVLDKLPGDDDVLTELEARGCRHQFEALVKEKMAAAARKDS
jgi:hypothetical protein